MFLAVQLWLWIAVGRTVSLCVRQLVVRDVEGLHLVGPDHPNGPGLGAQDVDQLQRHLVRPEATENRVWLHVCV